MITRLVQGGHVDYALAIDHGQFALLDRDGIIDVDAYTPEAQSAGVAQFGGGIVVFTESHWTTHTPLRVHLVEGQPDVTPAEHEHVALGGLDCVTGELRIFSPEETGANERMLALPPGRYGVVVEQPRWALASP